MYPAKFEYYRATSIQEAISLCQQHSGAKLLAGGHSLIPMMKLRLAQPLALIDIGRIAELSEISKTNGTLRIGSLTTHATLAASGLLRQHCPILAEAAVQIADPQVRNKGTVGGNIAHADPGSDLPAVIVALDGVIHATGAGGDRSINASDFFLDLLMTDLGSQEILTAVELAVIGERTGSCYLKWEHPASGYAVCGAAAIVELASNGSCQRASLCFSGVTSTPYRAAAVTDALAGKSLEEATIDQALDKHLAIADPMGDIYASGPYRVEIAKVYGKRALKMAYDRARGSKG